MSKVFLSLRLESSMLIDKWRIEGGICVDLTLELYRLRHSSAETFSANSCSRS
uniref:Uncharacterized protein n=1 Tax=Arundo donax TaxID=35708 RepID=A0A0A9D1Y2_ARUDO